MPQLPVPVEGPSERIVTEGCLKVELSVFADSDFELVFRASICNDLPVVSSFLEAFVCDDTPENVLLFLEVQASIVCSQLDDV